MCLCVCELGHVNIYIWCVINNEKPFLQRQKRTTPIWEPGQTFLCKLGRTDFIVFVLLAIFFLFFCFKVLPLWYAADTALTVCNLLWICVKYLNFIWTITQCTWYEYLSVQNQFSNFHIFAHITLPVIVSKVITLFKAYFLFHCHRWNNVLN